MARCPTARNTEPSSPGSPSRRRGNGATIKTGSPVTAETIDAVLVDDRPDHVVVASGARYRRDGFQGQTGKALPGWETGRCVTWDEIALDKVTASGDVLVIDELADVAAPLTAVKLARLGAKVRLLTKWPMVGMETAAEVYLHWVLTYLYEADVEMIGDHAVTRIAGNRVEITNIYAPTKSRQIGADTIVMATARSSENAMYHLLRERGAQRRSHRLRGSRRARSTRRRSKAIAPRASSACRRRAAWSRKDCETRRWRDALRGPSHFPFSGERSRDYNFAKCGITSVLNSSSERNASVSDMLPKKM